MVESGWLRPLARLELVGYDALFALRGPDPKSVDPSIAVVGFTRESERTLGVVWPPPRKLHAQVIRNLKADGAKVIVYDALFTTPSTQEDDKALDAELKEAGNVVLACRLDRDLSTLRVSGDFPYYDDAQDIDFEAEAKVGFAEVQQDEDGIVRQFLPVMTFQDEPIPSLAAAALQLMSDSSVIEGKGEELRIAGVRLSEPSSVGADPFYEGQRLVSFAPDFAGGANAFPHHISFESVANGGFPKGSFEGKVVFVGVTGLDLAKQLGDMYATAYTHFNAEQVGGVSYSKLPGVVVQAHLYNALSMRRFLHPAPEYVPPVLGGLYILGLVLPVRSYLGWKGPLLSLLTMLLLGVLTWTLFTSAHWYVPWVTPAFYGVAAASAAAWFDRGALKRKWAGYVSPKVLEQLLHDSGAAEATRCHGSVLFADIRGFTSFSEKHSPEKVVRVLNAQYERFTNIVHKEGGTLDKFMGDGLLAVFGAPVPQPDAALRAVRAAKRMKAASMVPIEDEGESHLLVTGFGVATGDFVAGHVGARKRHDYTIIGDTVNLASRLQGVTGEGDIVIDQPTADGMGTEFQFEPLGEVKLKGKAQPVACFRLI